MPWQAIASTATGVKHIESGNPCQDFGAYQIISNGLTIVGAVSDGMGSAKHSSIGSRLAVEVAISQLRLVNCQLQLSDEQSTRDLFSSVLGVIRFQLENLASTSGYELDDLACTLIAFVATPSLTAAMQIGDGLIVVRSQTEDYQLLFKPDKGEFANETTSVTSSNVMHEMQVCLQPILYKFICVATDGIENISLDKSKNWEPSDSFFKPIEKYMLVKESLEQKQKKLVDFLNSPRINQVTDDDKTLLLCVYEDHPSFKEQFQYQGNAPENNQHFFVEEKILKMAGSVSQSKMLTFQPLNSKELERQDFELIKADIINHLRFLESKSFVSKLRFRKNCLEIWLSSNQPLECKKHLARIIFRFVVDIKNLPIRRVKILNHLTNCEQELHWIKSFSVVSHSKLFIDLLIIIAFTIFSILLVGILLYYLNSLLIYYSLFNISIVKLLEVVIGFIFTLCIIYVWLQSRRMN